MAPNGKSTFGTLLALSVGLTCISFSAILIRLTVSPAVTVATWRMVIAGILLLSALVWRRRTRITRRAFLLSLFSGAFLALHFSTWIASLRYTTVASSVVLVSTNPLFVGLFSLLLGERPSRKLWEGIFISTVGAVLIGWGDLAVGGKALWGDLLALLGAMMASAYLIVGRRVRQDLGLLPYITLSYSTAGILLMAFLGVFSQGIVLPEAPDWPWLILLALGPQLLGHTSFNWALKFLPAVVVALVILGEPILSSLWAYLIFGEGIGSLQGVGFALVLLGIARGLGGKPDLG